MRSDVHDLAVIGGGPAGLATVLAARTLAPHWRVLWCRGPDPAARAFLPAFGGNSLVHRLNVPVERMGLDAAAPVDFLDWLRREHPQRDAHPGQFVPRRWFGDYLAHRASEAGADELFGEVHELARPDANADRRCPGLGAGWRVGLAEGMVRRAVHVALAVGLPAGLPMPNAPANWVADPWAWWRTLGDAPLPLGRADTVLVVGSGLTAVDMVLGLRERGFGGGIRVVSPGGAWSHAHEATSPLDAGAQQQLHAALDAATGARHVLRVLRAAAALHPWRAVVDALRVSTNRHWSALPEAEQRRLLRHAFTAWNRHRHRMAPDVRAALAADRALGLEPGRVHVVDGAIVKRHRGLDERIEAALVLDCRGPGFRSALAGDSLLARLVRSGVLEAHPLGTGVRAPRDPTLAVVGGARFGECFETTAVPELRQQAVAAVGAWLPGDQPSTRGIPSASQSLGTR